MRVFVGGIVTETNTFSPMPTGPDDWEVIRDLGDLPDGVEMPAALAAFQRKAAACGDELVFGLHAFAMPAGLTVRRAWEGLADELTALLDAALEAGPVDAVLLPLHGAMVAEGEDDCEGALAARVRERVGPDVPIGVELDLHCHLTERLLEAADAVVIFKEYPHTDMGDRAEELYDIIAATVAGGVRPTMAMFRCRMIGMYLTPFEPVRSFVDAMREAEARPGVLSLSLAHGFPWGDVPDCETRMLVVTDGDGDLAREIAEEFGRRFYALRREASLRPTPIGEALDWAGMADTSTGPVVIADQSDNPGGGAPSDATFVLRELLERGAENAALGMIWDPAVVHLAMAAGEGARLRVRLGGKMGPMSGDPLDLDVTVKGVIPGMTQEWPQTTGSVTEPCGDAVLLGVGGVDVVVNTRRGQVLGPEVFGNFGIDPAKKSLLVVKSTQHFYAGFAPIASQVIHAAARGAVAPIMEDIPFERADTGVYPWVEDPLGADGAG